MTAGPENPADRGAALLVVMMLLALLMALSLGYHTLTRIGISTTDSTMESVSGLYSAEAGLNIRADLVREIFWDYNRPIGVGPDTTQTTCVSGNLGSGDMACTEYALTGNSVMTYLTEDGDNPKIIRIPRGELYQNLHAQEYNYVVNAVTRDEEHRARAQLELHFKSRLVPLFQFAVFYGKDLEITPGPSMTIAGPVHTNGDLYLNAGYAADQSLDIEGQVTSAGTIFSGRKHWPTCMPGSVTVLDPENASPIPDCEAPRVPLAQNDLEAWNGMMESGIEELTVPPPETLDPTPGQLYWDRAEIRIVMNAESSAIEVRNPDGTKNLSHTDALNACGACSSSNEFYNHRQKTLIKMLDVEMDTLFNCIHNNNLMGPGVALDETSDGGLVFYFDVEGPAAAGLNDYGVRLRDGRELESTAPSAPPVQGLTVVTSQAVYIEGDYNKLNKKPAAIFADSLNVLSNAWNDDNGAVTVAVDRPASSTTIHAAFLTGTDTTGLIEGEAGQDQADPKSIGWFNGGFENFPRLHEDWWGVTLTYRGSMVSLYTPDHVDGRWLYDGVTYTAPNRDWQYDTDFDDAAGLPPLTPRFVYLRQELFLRHFEL